MYEYDRFDSQDQKFGRAQGLVVVLLIAAFIMMLYLAPRHDPSKLIAGMRCSVVSENDISALLHTPMRLVPTSGTVCQYVSTDARIGRTLYVVAHGPQSPGGAPAVAFKIFPRDGDDPAAAQLEMQLARMTSHSKIAQNR